MGKRIVEIPLRVSLRRSIAQIIQATVDDCGGNRAEAARWLEISPRTVAQHIGGRKRPGRPVVRKVA